MLRRHPKLGRPGRMVISRTPFIAVYRLKGTDRIEVIRLLHGSQQWPPGGRE